MHDTYMYVFALSTLPCDKCGVSRCSNDHKDYIHGCYGKLQFLDDD